MNLLPFLFQKSTSINMSKNDTTQLKIKNKIIYRNNKSLRNKHIITKNFFERPFEFVLKKFHFKKNRCLYCNAYQYNNECYKIKRKSKYWHCCSNDKIFNKLFIAKNDVNNIEKLFNDSTKNKFRTIKKKIKRKLYVVMYNMKFDSNNFDKKRKTKINKRF